MFSLFIRRDGLINPPNLGSTDFHCHILPDIDDGPKDERGSLAIATLLLELGVNRICCTPHVISDLYPNTTEKIVARVNEFQKTLNDRGIPLELIPAAEYYAEPAFLDRIEKGDILCTGEKRYVLFESPAEHPPRFLKDIIFALQTQGYTPLLAHVERYYFIQKDYKFAKELKRLGVAFQVNHPSFLLPKTSQRGNCARWLYKKGFVDELGSDIHRAAGFPTVQSQSKVSATL
ncbi:MAG: capsular biosynthesis protein [Deltaproteobacteria bacterium]|nr:capsular biosynthesis protein [Deltaproteobacteria bacterium]MBN2673723.1 capsular biosynthesis protein [Deltaproteobacteria bacterium]